MSFLAAAAPSIISAGLSLGSQALMSGNESTALSGFRPGGFNAGGLKASYGANGRLLVNSDGARENLVNRTSKMFGLETAELAKLRASVAPGMSDLRKSRLGEIDNARTAAIGNLRDNLARRRVLGSSFGQDAITRAESEFAGQRDKVAAESFLQELELTNRLIDQEFDTRRQVFSTKLNELNLQADLAAKLSGAATETLGANARMQAQLDAKAAEGAGSFFGTVTRPAFNSIGTSVGSTLFPKTA